MESNILDKRRSGGLDEDDNLNLEDVYGKASNSEKN